MTIVKANLRLEGSKEHSEGIALVDTGASATIIDKDVAEKIGVTHLKRTLTLTTASGHKMEGELAVISRLIIEGEELPYAHLLILKIPEEVKEMLRSKHLSDWGIIGLTTPKLERDNSKTPSIQVASPTRTQIYQGKNLRISPFQCDVHKSLNNRKT